jgi:hypothetical protein
MNVKAFFLLVGSVCALSGAAAAQSIVIDPNRPVRGSCGEVLQPLFAGLRAAAVAQGIGRIELEVLRAPDTGVVTVRTVSQRNFAPEGEAQVHAAFQQAYESAEEEGCVGVITRRTRWIVRKGALDLMWAPDDPLVVNRPVAATTMADGVTRIELVDPALGFSRLAGPQSGARCYFSGPFRDMGELPPTAQMPRNTRYRVRFRLGADGRVETVRLPEGVRPDSPLAAALERYVRRARYYPEIGEDCTPQSSWLSIISERF